jgi:hypothetical protein
MSYPAFGMRTAAFGSGFRPPTAIRHLPVDLLRTSLVTRDPAATAAAIDAFRQQGMAPNFVPTQILPQAMLFQQNKRDPGGATRGPLRDPRTSPQGLVSALDAVARQGAVFNGRPAPAGVQQSMWHAARDRGGQIMSQPTVGPRTPDMSRVRPIIQPIDAPPDAYGIAQGRMQQAVAASKATDAASALATVAHTKASYRRMLGF